MTGTRFLLSRTFILAAVVALVGCSGSSKPAAVAPTTTATTSGGSGGVGASASTTVAIQTSGARTVLSPIGINVRAQPSKTAAVLGSAAQGATLTVLGHSDGWYQVKGSTVTGYITDDPTLSAAGKFMAYSSDQVGFSALYPSNWNVIEAPPSSVVFRPPTGHDSIVVSAAATKSQLPRDQLSYHQVSSDTLVVCGVTGQLNTFTATTGTATSTVSTTTATTLVTGSTVVTPPTGVVGERYLVQIQLTLDPQHALGVEANLADLTQLPAVENVLESISFPFPQCQGGTADQTSSTAVATTIQ